MNIQTSYKVSIGIDDETFNVTVSELSEVNKKIISEMSESIKSVSNTMRILSEKVEEASTNAQILENLKNGVEKLKLLFEQKSLNKEISALKNTIEKYDYQDMTKDLYMKRLTLSIFGEDKEKLLKEIKKKSIDPQRVLTVISEQITENAKKKLNDLSNSHVSIPMESLS